MKRVLLCLCILPALGGCSALGGLAGAAAGIASGTFTSNPAVGVAVSVSVKAAADAGMKGLLRSLQQDEQDAIATLAGAMEPGEIRPWRIRHAIPYGNNQGSMQITRVIDTPLVRCKEVMFTVDARDAAAAADEPARSWFTAQVCRHEQRWKWAVAEPAVERWGSLQ
jgi:hypothetical protein